MAVTNQSTTIITRNLLDRSNFPSRREREEFYFVHARHVQAGAGDANSTVVLHSLPAGTIGGGLFALFRGPYGANGLVSLGLGAYTDLAGGSQAAAPTAFVNGSDAALAGLHKFNWSAVSLTGVNLLLTFTTGAASTLPDTTVHEIFLTYSVIPPVV